MFEYEEHIKCFIEVVGEFSNLMMDQEDEDPTEEQQTNWEGSIADHKILQLKGNIISRGLVPLERIFNPNDVATKPSEQEIEEEVEHYNIGTKEDPKIIKLAKGVPREYKQKYVDLFKGYKDVFDGSYDDLKTFYPTIIHQRNPLKTGVKPYKQKLRYINLFSLLSIEKEVK